MKTQGPSLKIINTCYNCEFFNGNFNGVKCEKLGKYLNQDYDTYIRPHELCPFLKSEKETLENKLAEIEMTESKKLEKLITNIFSGYDYNIDEYTGGIYLKVHSSIYSTSYSEFNEKLPDYEFSIDSYDSDTMQITIFKRAKNK